MKTKRKQISEQKFDKSWYPISNFSTRFHWFPQDEKASESRVCPPRSPLSAWMMTHFRFIKKVVITKLRDFRKIKQNFWIQKTWSTRQLNADTPNDSKRQILPGEWVDINNKLSAFNWRVCFLYFSKEDRENRDQEASFMLWEIVT